MRYAFTLACRSVIQPEMSEICSPALKAFLSSPCDDSALARHLVLLEAADRRVGGRRHSNGRPVGVCYPGERRITTSLVVSRGLYPHILSGRQSYQNHYCMMPFFGGHRIRKVLFPIALIFHA